MSVEDQAARLARESSAPLLVNVAGVWVNPGNTSSASVDVTWR